jgi:hypothetical protein
MLETATFMRDGSMNAPFIVRVAAQVQAAEDDDVF